MSAVMEQGAVALFDRRGASHVKLGEVARNLTASVRDFDAEGIERYVALEHMDSNSLRLQRWGRVAEGTTFTRRFSAGQTLFAKRRSYQRKCVVAPFDGVCSGDILVLEAIRDRLVPALLPYVLQTDALVDWAVRTSAGSLSPRTKWKDLGSFPLLLPELGRQQELAGLFDAVDADIFTKEDLVRHCVTARRAYVDEQMERPEFQDATVELDDLIAPDRPIAYGILMPGPDIPDGVPCVAVKDYPNGVLEVAAIQKTSHELDAEYARSRIAPGDLLLSIRGTVGRLAKVPAEVEAANISRDTARLALREGVDPDFVLALLRSTRLQRAMRVRTVGLAVQGINLRDVRKLRLPMPRDEEQHRMLARLRAFDAAVSRAERALQALGSLKAALLASLVSRPD